MSDLLDQAWESTNREADEKILIGGIADFDLRADIRNMLYELDSTDFWNPTYGKIWGVARQLADQSRIVTLQPFRAHLTPSEYQTLEAHTGMGVRLVEVTHGIEYVKEAAKRRRLLQGLKQIAATALRSEGYEDVLSAAHRVMDDVDGVEQSEDAADVAELVAQFWHEVAHPELMPAPIASPWKSLNEVLSTRGWLGGMLITIGAFSSRGKSLVMTNCAEFAALDGYKVAVFSMEMPRKEVFNRLLAAASRQRLTPIKRREVDEIDGARLKATTDQLAETTLRIWDDGSASVDFVRQQCMLMKRTVGLDLVVVDYLQILDESDGDNREQRVSSSAKKLKALAMKLDVPVITASQLNDSEKGGPLSLSSMRESKGIGNNSDIVILVEHEEFEGKPTGDAWFNIVKQRDGRLTKVPVSFDGHVAAFSEARGSR